MRIRNVRAVAETGVHERADIDIVDGKIAAIRPDTSDIESVGETIDGSGLTLLPGFIDVHIHGGGGFDTMDATPEALQAICRTHAAHGTTGLLLTTITQSNETISEALRAAHAAYASGGFTNDGAAVLGIHLEGPYISAKRPGAQPKQYVRPYEAAEFADWLEISAGAMKRITLASEEPGGIALIAACIESGIAVSLGHTDATAEQAYIAADAGAAHATHLFNAMPALHHRNPGILGAALTDPRFHCEVIADGHHVAPEIVRLTLAAKGDRGMILITDAMSGAGAADGEYDLGGAPVTVKDGRALLADGTLAGSLLTMDTAVRNVRKWTGATWESLALLSSTNAADSLGLPHKGRIAAGADADLVLMDDDLTVRATFVGGRQVYTG